MKKLFDENDGIPVLESGPRLIFILFIIGLGALFYIFDRQGSPSFEKVRIISRDHEASPNTSDFVPEFRVRVSMPDGSDKQLNSAEYFLNSQAQEACLQSLIGRLSGIARHSLVPMEHCQS